MEDTGTREAEPTVNQPAGWIHPNFGASLHFQHIAHYILSFGSQEDISICDHEDNVDQQRLAHNSFQQEGVFFFFTFNTVCRNIDIGA